MDAYQSRAKESESETEVSDTKTMWNAKSLTSTAAGWILSMTAFLDAADSSTQLARPNIILAMADDMGWGDPGFNGNQIIKTPHLDEMAKAGLRFDRFYAGGAVCSPTRGSCLTGRHPYRYGVWSANQGHLRKEEMSLAEVVKTQGYTTGHFGKWHLGTLDPTRSGKGAGRDAARNYMTPGMKGADEWFGTEYGVRLWDPITDSDVNPYYHNGKLASENLQGDDSRVLMDRAIPFIRKAATEKQPFLAVIWFHAPHEPVFAGPEFLKMYAGREEGERHFYGVITALDLQMGRLRKELRDLGIADNTMLLDFRESCLRSAAGKDYATPFTPDSADVNPNTPGGTTKKNKLSASEPAAAEVKAAPGKVAIQNDDSGIVTGDEVDQ